MDPPWEPVTSAPMGDLRYVRYQSAEPNARGIFPGVFMLVNVLGKGGQLTAEQESFRRRSNDWYDAAYPDPMTVDSTVYDRAINPGAAAWFKVRSAHLVDRVAGYLAILDAHGVEWRRLESDDPGRVIYEDVDQVVVVPRQLTEQLADRHRRQRTLSGEDLMPPKRRARSTTRGSDLRSTRPTH
jgi:hypothetical protein